MNKSIWLEKVENNIPNFDIKCYAAVSDPHQQGIGISMHNHWQLEIMYVETGVVDYEIYNEKQVSLRAGDIIFVNAMVPHETQTREQNNSVYVLQFVPDDFLKGTMFDANKYLRAFIRNNNVSWYVFKSSENEKMRECIKNIYQENLKHEKGYEIMILSNLYYILGELFRRDVIQFPTEANGINVNYMQKAIAFIDENYMNNITLKDVCIETNISETHFCRIFKKITGTSFVRYLNFKRVCEAEKLLSRTDKSVTEIAYEVGFASSSYFDRIFKKHYKISPTKYRNMQKE